MWPSNLFERRNAGVAKPGQRRQIQGLVLSGSWVRIPTPALLRFAQSCRCCLFAYRLTSQPLWSMILLSRAGVWHSAIASPPAYFLLVWQLKSFTRTYSFHLHILHRYGVGFINPSFRDESQIAGEIFVYSLRPNFVNLYLWHRGFIRSETASQRPY